MKPVQARNLCLQIALTHDDISLGHASGGSHAVTTYAIVFKGELRDGFILEAVTAAFRERTRLGDAQIEQIFSGRKVTLKKGLTRDEARQFARDLRAIGMRIIAATEGGSAPADTPAPGTHHILFGGLVVEGFDAEAVKLMAAKRLKFSERQADLLFSGAEVTMKRGLNEEKARHYADTLRKLGMEVRVEPPLPAPPMPDAAIVTAEASLLQTQLAPAAPYNFEETFHSSSTLEMLNGTESEDRALDGIHPSLQTPAPNDAAAVGTGTKTHQHAATIVNHDLASAYAEALQEPDTDPEIEALRAAHDPDSPPETIAAPDAWVEPTPAPDVPVRSPFHPSSEPPPPAPETVMSPLEPAPAAVRGRATTSVMPPEDVPELEAIQHAAEEKRKWLMAGGFILMVAAIAVWALM